MKKRTLLFIRTFKLLSAGGPGPPLGLLYLASVIRDHFGPLYEPRIYDTGVNPSSIEEIKTSLQQLSPTIVGLSTMSCEADLMHRIAAAVKEVCGSEIPVIVGGPHSKVEKERLLGDVNIDYVVIGEGERTIVELLEALQRGTPLSGVAGIAFRKEGGSEVALTAPRPPIEDLDALPLPAWDLVDLKQYARYPNWNGELKEGFYVPVVTTRGCPFHCFYCHNVFGKKIRARSPESVFSEIEHLYRNLGVREIHIIDDVFNFNPARALKLCSMIEDSGMHLSFAFPNGLRADIMTADVIKALKRIGTYKIHYGFETATPRLQRLIRKNLDIPKAVQTINMTADAGIITGAYFMFGFPSETRQEIRTTIDFAVRSKLDVAYFFKVTPYPGSELFNSLEEPGRTVESGDYGDYHFYSTARSCSDIPPQELNGFILEAQQRFFSRPVRLWRSYKKSPHKLDFFKKLVHIFAVMIQAYIIRKLAQAPKSDTAGENADGT